MIVKVDRELFLRSFLLCDVVASVESVRPILGQFLLDASDGVCRLRSADLAVSVSASLDGVTVIDPGRALLPRGRTRRILTACLDETLEIASTESSASFRGQGVAFDLLTPDADQFPPIPDVSDGVAHVMGSGDLLNIIRFARVAAGSSGGTKDVLVESGTGGLGRSQIRMISTDGRRLAIASTDCEVSLDGPTPMARRGMISQETLRTISHAMDSVTSHVTFVLGTYDFSVRTDRLSIDGQQGTGRFPVYAQAFPKSEPTWIHIDAKVFLSALEQAEAFTDTVSNTRGVQFTFGRTGIRMFAVGGSSIESGSVGVCKASIEIPLELEIGDVAIRLDPGYMLRAMQLLEGATDVFLGIVDGKSAATTKVESLGFQYLVMPMSE